MATVRLCGRSNLSLDVDFTERSVPWTLKKTPGFARHENDRVRAVFEKVLALIVDDELSCIAIRLEAELLCDETQLYARFVPATH